MSDEGARAERARIDAELRSFVTAEIERMPVAERDGIRARTRRQGRINALRGAVVLFCAAFVSWLSSLAAPENGGVFLVARGGLAIGVGWLTIGIVLWARSNTGVTAVARQRVLQERPELAARVRAVRAEQRQRAHAWGVLLGLGLFVVIMVAVVTYFVVTSH